MTYLITQACTCYKNIQTSIVIIWRDPRKTEHQHNTKPSNRINENFPPIAEHRVEQQLKRNDAEWQGQRGGGGGPSPQEIRYQYTCTRWKGLYLYTQIQQIQRQHQHALVPHLNSTDTNKMKILIVNQRKCQIARSVRRREMETRFRCCVNFTISIIQCKLLGVDTRVVGCRSCDTIFSLREWEIPNRRGAKIAGAFMMRNIYNIVCLSVAKLV